MIEIRQAEPYSYCQFVMGRDHTAYGRARHPWLTGSAGWTYTAVTHWILGIRPGFAGLVVDPCIPADWKEFDVTRQWRGATYDIKVRNPNGVREGRQVGDPERPADRRPGPHPAGRIHQRRVGGHGLIPVARASNRCRVAAQRDAAGIVARVCYRDCHGSSCCGSARGIATGPAGSGGRRTRSDHRLVARPDPLSRRLGPPAPPRCGPRRRLDRRPAAPPRARAGPDARPPLGPEPRARRPGRAGRPPASS